jgi:opacity protein-like surface antigen
MAGLFLSSALVLGAHSTAVAASAVVNDLRVGEHPGATRVVLDISQRTNATFDVSNDGRTLFIVLPDAEWRAGTFAAKHAKGLLTDFKQSTSGNGVELSLVLDQPVRIKPPFFVAPEGTQGERVVIDIIPDPTMAAASKAAPKAAQAAATPSAAMLPPTDIAIEKRMVAGPSNIVPPETIPQAAPVEVAQASYTLSPNQKPTHTAPQMAQLQSATATTSGPGGLLYVKAAAGLNVMEESDADGTSNNAAIETDFGWIANGGLGLDLKNGFRLEGEVLYSQNKTSQITGTANGTAVNSGQGEGDVSLLGFMANIAYDFNTPYAVTPFIFGGAGVANISLNGVGAAGSQTYDSSDTVFAMQAGAGISTDLTDRTSVDLSYRYLETLDAQMSDANGAPFDFRYATHMFLMGLKYKM